MFGLTSKKPNKSILSNCSLSSGLDLDNTACIAINARGKVVECSHKVQQTADRLKEGDVYALLPANTNDLVRRIKPGSEPVVKAVELCGENWFWTFRGVDKNTILAVARVQNSKSKTSFSSRDEAPTAAKPAQQTGQTTIEHLPVAMCITGEDFVIRSSTRPFNDLFKGINVNEYNLLALLPIAHQSEQIKKILKKKSALGPFRIKESSKGNSFWDQQEKVFELFAQVTRSDKDNAIYWILRDVTREVSIEQDYRYVKHKFDSSIQAANEGIWEWAQFGQGKEWWSDVMYKLLGLDKKAVSPSLAQLKKLMHPADKKRFDERLAKEQECPQSFKLECRLTVKEKGFRWFLLRVSATLNDDQKVKKIVGSLVDIHKETSARLQLQREKNKVIATLDSIVDAVISTNQDGIVEYMNSAASRLTGLTIAKATGRHIENLLQFFQEHTSDVIENPVLTCLQTGERMAHKIYADMLDLNGTRYTVQVMATPLITSDERLFGAVLVLNDVTNIRVLSRRLKYQASHDVLTKLLNRTEYERRVKQAIQIARVEQVSSVLMYVDLDRFKLINDVCGHIAGDELLKQIAKLIKNIVRRRDSVARIGGDEFAILLEECSMEAGRKVAQKVLHDISTYRFSWDGKTFTVEASIGLAEINEECESMAYILNAVDGACYLAKEAGRNCVKEFKEGDEKLAERRVQERSLQRFDYVIENDQFELYAQPIENLNPTPDTGVSFEILIRMLDEEGKIVPPNAFLPAVERFNRAYKLDLWIIEHVFMFLNEHRDLFKQIDKCSINLSGQSLAEEGLLDYVIKQAAKYKIPTNRICFEITETAAIANLTTAIDLIHSLKSKGFLFALDDFGAGLSSFAYLKSLPVDFLKIDGIFVKDINQDEVNRAMVKAITDLGKVLKKRTIAEYVENQEIVEILREMGVDYGQGFHLGRPVPIAELFDKIKKKSLYRKARVA